jgi:hypothetical protein
MLMDNDKGTLYSIEISAEFVENNEIKVESIAAKLNEGISKKPWY